jgi:hypothetical protein
MQVAVREGGRRPSRRLNDAPHSGKRARLPASRRKETSSFTTSILLPTPLFFIHRQSRFGEYFVACASRNSRFPALDDTSYIDIRVQKTDRTQTSKDGGLN